MQKNILEYLEQTVKECPDKIAFSTGEESMTFSEIYEGARSVGSFLSDKGIYKKAVAVIMDKHPKTVTAFFGIIYAGCFYVCIDEKSPKARIDAILQKLSPAGIICDSKNEKIARSCGDYPVWLYDEIANSGINNEALKKIRQKQISTDAIYVVFTSGSTGTPKGVVAAHRSVIDYTEALCKALRFTHDTVFANQTPLYFDAPLKEIMPTLKLGATTYFPKKMLFSFPVKMVEYLDTYKINTICWVVSALVQFTAVGIFKTHIPKYLTTVAFGSEKFERRDYDAWRKALPNAVFFNLYGPTEATGMSCFWEADRELAENEPIPIGAPFDNTDIILVDSEGKEAAEGEICIRGTCLTFGYFNDREKTDEAFVQNPLNTAYTELVYRTGDLGRMNEYGELVFISRKDLQIKHMGHRIELGEIESSALKIAGVSRACCVYDDENKRIALYYTGDIEEKELMRDLGGFVPRYMLPAITEKLTVFPFTANGKLDRKGLKEKAKATK